MGAGGIVVREGERPLIALVQRRKDDAWVLPKGKLKRKEKPVAAAEREVVEETGFKVEVHEYLGVISYNAGRKPKLVEFWRMQALSNTGRKVARDVKGVQWLPLDAAIARLELPLEQLFLRNVGSRLLAPSAEPTGSVAPLVAAPPAALAAVADRHAIVAAPAGRKSFFQLILDAVKSRRRSRA
jgi:8-oxo-dGTP diphosphatase